MALLFTADYFVMGYLIPEVSALAFSAGHLPATQMFFGRITEFILVRCFLLNGAFALFFGRWFYKYGIQYAMLGHFGIHLISKVILICII